MRKSARTAEHQRFLELMIAARNKAGLTQASLAARLKRPQSFVAKYENGERRLDVIEFITIAEELGANPAALVRSLSNSRTQN